MLYRKGRQWMLCPYKINYMQHGEQHEQYASEKDWWLDFEGQWEHTKIIGIIEVEYTDEQVARYEDVRFMPEDFSDIYSAYVEFGSFPDRDDLQLGHPFRLVQLKKENERLGVEVSQREINEITHGIQLSEFEIRLMIGGL